MKAATVLLFVAIAHQVVSSVSMRLNSSYTQEEATGSTKFPVRIDDKILEKIGKLSSEEYGKVGICLINLWTM